MNKLHTKKELESAYLLGVFNSGGINALSKELDNIKESESNVCEDILNVAKKYNNLTSVDDGDLTSKSLELIQEHSELINLNLEKWIKRTLQNKKKSEKAKTNAKTKEIDIDAFLLWFNKKKSELLGGGIGKFCTLPTEGIKNLTKLREHYKINDFDKAIKMMSLNDWVIETNNFTPNHFLKGNNFMRYLNGTETDKKTKFGEHVRNVNESEIEKLKNEIKKQTT